MEHMVICQEPYLSWLLQGKKLIETRWSKTKRTPFEKVKEGDTLFLKKSGGLVLGECKVKSVAFYELNPKPAFTDKIIREWNESMLIQPNMIPKCLEANYGSFIWVEKVQTYDAKGVFGWRHIGQDAWIILKDDWKKDIIGKN